MSDNLIETIEYKGYEIEILRDDNASNPFEDWDCEPPLAVAYDRSITEYATQYGNVNETPTLSAYQIRKHLPELLAMTECKSRKELVEYGSDYSDDSTECINYAISEYVRELGNSDRLEALCTLYNMAGIPALCNASRGYCQGDYSLVLAVATPEFQKACGNGKNFWKNPESLQPSIDLFSAWAWGDVYGYNIEALNESCWGYYGDNQNTNGLLEDAKGAIDYHIEHERKSHLEQVKTWIRNHVPLNNRVFA